MQEVWAKDDVDEKRGTKVLAEAQTMRIGKKQAAGAGQKSSQRRRLAMVLLPRVWRLLIFSRLSR
jgi:hypothetical protein